MSPCERSDQLKAHSDQLRELTKGLSYLQGGVAILILLNVSALAKLFLA